MPILNDQVPNRATDRSAAVRLAGRRPEERDKTKGHKSNGKTELVYGKTHNHVRNKIIYIAKAQGQHSSKF